MKHLAPEAVYLLAGGGHAHVVLDALLSDGVQVAGILDPNLTPGERLFGIPVLGGDDYLVGLSAKDILLVNGLGANPETSGRAGLFNAMKARGFAFGSVRHRSAITGRECELGEGCQMMAGVVLQCRVRLGNNAVINTRASVDHDCTIGSHAFISPGAILCGDVTVAECAFVGAGAVILPGVSIGESAVVGAGAMVTKPVSAGWIVAGNPAVKIGTNA